MKNNTNYLTKNFIAYIKSGCVFFLFSIFVLCLTACNEHAIEQNTMHGAVQERTTMPEDVQEQTNVPQAMQEQTTVPEAVQEQTTVPQTINEYNINFITQTLNNIDRIIILLDPNEGGTLITFYITEQVEIEHLYNLLTETIIKVVNKYPTHNQSFQSNVEFIVRLEYRDGNADEFFDYSRRSLQIARFLDTRGPHNNEGFIVGENIRIWDFVYNISNQ